MDYGDRFESTVEADSNFMIEDDVGANVILSTSTYSSQRPSQPTSTPVKVPNTEKVLALSKVPPGKVLTLSKVPAGKVPPGKELTPVKVLASGQVLTSVKVLEPGKVIVNTSQPGYAVQVLKEEPPDQIFYDTASVVMGEENVAMEEYVKTEMDFELQDATAAEAVQYELVFTNNGSLVQSGQIVQAPSEHDYVPAPAPAAPEYFCGVCGKSFVAERRVRQHMSLVHLPKQSAEAGRKKPAAKKIVCELCGKKYPSNAQLRYHQRTHTGEKPYQCTMCPKAFTMPFFLQIHVRTHTGERPYPCSKCPKAFTNPAALWRHNRVHTGERPYTCGTCGKSFTQSNSLKLHIRTVHLKQPAPYVSKERRLRQLMKKQMEAQGEIQIQAKPKHNDRPVRQNSRPVQIRQILDYVDDGASLEENFVVTNLEY